MTSTQRQGCAKCGASKPPWFEYCGRCYAQLQLVAMASNQCDEQDCDEVIDDDHFLCRRHWQKFRAGVISECPDCGEYKPDNFPLCRRCNIESSTRPARQVHSRTRTTPEPRRPVTNTRRPYEHHDGEDDQKAKDKRYWFNRQNNGVCNYCGHRYPYDQLEMEHMIPKELGGPDHRRNMQLACKICNQKKGTSTDIEFRALNAALIPRDERKPPRRPVDPAMLKSGNQGGRYREPNTGQRTSGRERGTNPNYSRRPRNQGR